ncbi:hypothetical protein B296_00031266 [Ensete ventricosum]|uniref:HMA domain-containing protein n=1 Tax=Ensete ventricosum TaxID=4639 RepID=A0A426X6F0_ENSVE|nr:hypothetical protein B296_00031266 [Ensete ventricosum]
MPRYPKREPTEAGEEERGEKEDLEATSKSVAEEKRVGMTCAACAGSVEKAIKRLPGIHDARRRCAERQRFLHLPTGVVPPAASIALFSLSRVPIRVIAHRLSVLYREGTTSSFLLSNDSKSTTAALLSLPFRSTHRLNRSSISSVEVNRRQTFIVVDNTTVSLTPGQDLRPSQDLDLAGA